MAKKVVKTVKTKNHPVRPYSPKEKPVPTYNKKLVAKPQPGDIS